MKPTTRYLLTTFPFPSLFLDYSFGNVVRSIVVSISLSVSDLNRCQTYTFYSPTYFLLRSSNPLKGKSIPKVQFFLIEKTGWLLQCKWMSSVLFIGMKSSFWVRCVPSCWTIEFSTILLWDNYVVTMRHIIS